MLTSIASAVAKNLLYVLRYPALPLQSDLLGEFRVGAIQAHIPGNSNGGGLACQIHYPTLDHKDTIANNNGGPTTPYMRPEAVEGLANYSRQPVQLLQFLSMRQHPCLMNAAPLLSEDGHTTRQFPIVVFSHGLGGCLEMYTELCTQVASMGYWVIALEHQDGSGAYADTIIANNDNNDGKSRKSAIYYKRPDDTPYSRQKVVNFRKDFLSQRVDEITQVLDYVRYSSTNENASDETDSPSLLQKVCQAADKDPKNTHLLGHSFGGATMVRAAQDERLTQRHPIASMSLLDCWAFSLDDDTLQRGCNTFGGGDAALPTLSILSEAWLSNPETEQVLQLLQNSSPLHTFSYYCPNSMHISFSDAVNWFPGWVARTTMMRARKEQRHATIRTTAQACVKHMMRQQQQQQQQQDDGTEGSSLREDDFLATGLKEFAIGQSAVQQPATEAAVSAS